MHNLVRSLCPKPGAYSLDRQKGLKFCKTWPIDFETDTIYYLIIDAHDGSDYTNISKSYTFRIIDQVGTIQCGEYTDVPVVQNFGIMFELEGNEQINLNT